MFTSNFGSSFTYYSQSKNVNNNLSKLIKEEKFRDFSPEGITSFLSFRHPIGRYTMFKNFGKFPFGANQEEQLWFPKFSYSNDTFKDSMIKIERLLTTSISKLTKDKKKIGVALSGGLDSSLIVGIIRKLNPSKDIYTYSAGFYGDDEFEYSRLIARENKTIHKEFRLGKEDFFGESSLIKDLIEFKAAPLHPNELPLAYIEKRAVEDSVDIVLCGEGADDIFGGYGKNFRMYMNYNHKESFFNFFLNNYRYFTIPDREIIKDKYLVDDFDLTINSLNLTNLDTDIRNWAIYFTQVIHTPGLIFRGANAMRFNNLPLGFPYINGELVNYVNSLPFEYKVTWKYQNSEINATSKSYQDISEVDDIPKYILKKIAEEYINHDVIYRPKVGFPVPFDNWLKNVNDWNLNKLIFKHNDISKYSGWKKFMLINLSIFADIFENYIDCKK